MPTRITGLIAILMSFIYAVLLTIMQLFGIQLSDVSIAYWSIAYWSIVLGMGLTYLFKRLEEAQSTQNNILLRPVQGVEIFETSRSFLERLADITVGAETVSTINFSPWRGASPHLDRYFDRVHSYINSDDSRLASFKSLASVDSTRKAEFILHRINLLRKKGTASFAVFKSPQIDHLMCFHVASKNGKGYVFLYPPVPLGGEMKGILVINDEIADVMKAQFDRVWNQAIIVSDGTLIKSEGLDLLRKLFPDITESTDYNSIDQVT